MIRKAYLKKTKSALRSLSEEIDVLKASAGSVGTGLRKKFDEELDAVAGLEKAARERIGELAEAGEAHWGRFKAGVDHALDDLGKAVRAASDRIRKTGLGGR
jgi:hypothetical protein